MFVCPGRAVARRDCFAREGDGFLNLPLGGEPAAMGEQNGGL